MAEVAKITPVSGVDSGSLAAGDEIMVRRSGVANPLMVPLGTVALGGVYEDRASAIAANVPPPVNAIYVLSSNGVPLAYQRDASGTALTTNDGQKWSPAGVITPDHFGENTSPGSTAMSTAMQAAVDYAETLTGGAEILLLDHAYLMNAITVNGDGILIRGMGYATEWRNNSTTAYSLTLAGADPFNGDKIKQCTVRDIYFRNTSTNPTAGAHVLMDLAGQCKVESCWLFNHFRGVEMLGCDASCYVQSCEITQGANTSATQAGSASIAVLRREVDSGFGLVSQEVTIPYDNEASGPFQVGETITSGAVSAVITGLIDSGTTGTIYAKDLTGGTFADDDTITGGTSSATADVNGTPTVKYYTEPNSVYIIGNNCRANDAGGAQGAEFNLLVGACDGLYVVGNHLGFGSKAVVGLCPEQANIALTNISVTGGFIDPEANLTDYGVRAYDYFQVGGSVMSEIFFDNVINGGADVDAVSVEIGVRAFHWRGGKLANAGRHGFHVNHASAIDVRLDGADVYKTNTDASTNAAVKLLEGDHLSVTNCNIRTGFRGVQVHTTATNVDVTGNRFEGMTDNTSIYVFSSPDASVHIGLNHIEETTTVASTATIRLNAGKEVFDITGTSTISAIRTASPTSTLEDRLITMIFAAAATVQHGAGVIELNANTNFTAAAGSTLSLRCKAGVWYEVGRSA